MFVQWRRSSQPQTMPDGRLNHAHRLRPGVAAGLLILAPVAVTAQGTEVLPTGQGMGLQLAEVAKQTPTPRPSWAAEGVSPTVWRLVEDAMASDDNEFRKELLRQAEAQVRREGEGNADDTSMRFALALVLGMRANEEGGRSKVAAASDLYVELQTILQREPDHARARHMLGRLHAAVLRMGRITRWLATNLLGGEELKTATWEEAELNLAFAESQSPEVADHHLQLGNLYRDTGRPRLALREMAHVLDMPAVSSTEHAVREEALARKEELEPKAEAQ